MGKNRPDHNPRRRANPNADEFDAVRFIGDATIYIKLEDDDSYSGVIEVPTLMGGDENSELIRWAFDDLHPSPQDARNIAADSEDMFDRIAQSAVSFGSYYTTHNRGSDTPDWAPDAETADDIDTAVSFDMNDSGNYSVRRKSGNGATRNPNPERNASWDNKDYTYYVVTKREPFLIDSGWEFKTDAQDRLNELTSEGGDFGVMARKSLPVDPKDGNNWVTSELYTPNPGTFVIALSDPEWTTTDYLAEKGSKVPLTHSAIKARGYSDEASAQKEVDRWQSEGFEHARVERR